MTKHQRPRRTYLAILVDGGGTVPPELGAVRRLTTRGHRVVVLAEGTMAAEVRAAGGEFVPWSQAPNRESRRPEDDPYRDWECKNPKQLLERLMEKQFVGPAAAYAVRGTSGCLCRGHLQGGRRAPARGRDVVHLRLRRDGRLPG